ncbi:hypothetical protein [Ramlibacter algicola]|uniref:Glyoxalase n=1 Tax=Ramlibacter algicola TaxID=2795217 RepID=A0A934Q4I1_9BURK|nr:hypothetical protein [Ramlibacter algicola]
MTAANLKAVELKAFVPAKDYALSKRFYADLGFTEAWRMRDFVLSDPSGVLWRIAQNV